MPRRENEDLLLNPVCCYGP